MKLWICFSHSCGSKYISLDTHSHKMEIIISFLDGVSAIYLEVLIRIDSACLIGNRYAIIPKTVGSRVTVDVMNTIDYIVVSKLFENSAN